MAICVRLQAHENPILFLFNRYVVIIQHKENLLSSYSFCSKALVRTGDEVNAGTPVAMSGSEVHDGKNGVLHLEMWLDGVPIDPAKYLSL